MRQLDTIVRLVIPGEKKFDIYLNSRDSAFTYFAPYRRENCAQGFTQEGKSKRKSVTSIIYPGNAGGPID